MDETGYGLRVSLNVPYQDAVARATDALKAQGFGVLTSIDVQQTLPCRWHGAGVPEGRQRLHRHRWLTGERGRRTRIGSDHDSTSRDLFIRGADSASGQRFRGGAEAQSRCRQ